MTILNGMLISITGIDGCGKSTQTILLSEYLSSLGYLTKIIRLTVSDLKCYNNFIILKKKLMSNDHNIPIYEKGLILAFETYLKIENEIKYLLKQGYVVITDRYIETNDIYLEHKGVNTSWIKHILSISQKPDFYFYIDIPAPIAYSRILKRNNVINKHENVKDLTNLRKLFLNKVDIYGYELIDGQRNPREILTIIINKLNIDEWNKNG